MFIWQWGLIGVSVLFLALFLLILWRYLFLKKQVAEFGEEVTNDELLERKESDVAVDKNSWLSLFEHQKNICTQLLAEVADSDEQNKASLTCWATFLEVEKQIIEQEIPNEKLANVLEAFGYILEKIDRVQEIDALFKSLKVNQALLSDLNKMIEKASDKVFEQVNITAELNMRLDRLHLQLNKETELDAMLAALRAEMASMIELAERLRLHLVDVKAAEGVDEAYVEALEAFLDSTEESTFLHSMRSEFDDKVEDLKHLADYQKDIITELQEQVRKAKGEEDSEKHIGSYDIAMVRLEKSLLESDRVVKHLERKLDSLQAVKYNLSIDIIRQNEAIAQKKALLESQQDEGLTGRNDIREVLEQEHETMRSMEDLLHQGAFTEESDAYVNEQSSKISSLRVMVNESELYVEMLERDLENTRVLRESLEYKLQQLEIGLGDGASSDEVTADELEEVENLREVNQELEEERKGLITALFDGHSQMDESIKLQQKIHQLDERIESIQRSYVEMEERYLTAIMAQEESS
ncbi:hypothetical protein [Marinomonas transparens]|uniref:Uncharacterized protein n=1 Tax=Marinomonas transparens TaxID=2795388 RepID=A0A934JWM6_9GAMM|nr:hypothetical protein [Marinomonas transparens]MBJ7539736.1 hypothetical protein [Marinomonas transparens]